MIIGASVAFGRIITLERIPLELAQFVVSVTENKYLVLIAAIVLLLIIGTFLETLASIVILTPVLLPVLTKLEIDLIHFGIVIIIRLPIGLLTPLLGWNIFRQQKIMKNKTQ